MSRKKDTGAGRASLDLMAQISRELNTPMDLHAILQRVVLLAMKSVVAINGSMIVLDEHGQPVDSILITGEDIHSNTTRQLASTLQNGLAGWVARNKQAALVPDTSQDERWLRQPDDALDRSGPKSALSAPILSHGQLVGVITLVHPKPGFFTPDHLLLVEIISDQAGIAIRNARFYAESQRQARVITALANSAMAITANLEVDEVLQRILEQTSQALRADVVSLALVDSKTQELIFYASTSQKHKSLVGVRLAPGQGVAGWVAKEGRGVVVPDVKRDSRFYPEIDLLLSYETRAIACAPIRSRGQVMGILEALNPLDCAFDADALLVLSGIGSLAGSALRHAQLFERIQTAHQRYRELFEDSFDPILITDMEGNILEANRQAERITGRNRQELRCKQIDQLQIVRTQVVGPDFSNLSPGRTLTYEAALPIQQGSPVPVEVHIRQIQIEGLSHIQWMLRSGGF